MLDKYGMLMGGPEVAESLSCVFTALSTAEV